MALLRRHRSRNLLIALGALVAAGWFLPSFFNVELYRHRLEQGLEQALGRPVHFGAMSLHLLPRPGFSVENALVGEAPAFGREPFARVDRINCEFGWRSLWSSHLDLARLVLVRPSVNLVRNSSGEWNVGSFIHESPMRPALEAGPEGDLDLEVEDGRVDIKLGEEKKPLAISDTSARVHLDRRSHLLLFHLAGSPMRTDLSLPTPGRLELDGEWPLRKNLDGPLRATLRTHGALLYDWVPLITGRTFNLYGLMDAEVQFSGSLDDLKVEGQSRLSQLHRWDQPPPTSPMPADLSFRLEFDRSQQRLHLESVVASFRDSQVHLTGSVENVSSSPTLDLVLAVERSKLEDFVALARRLTGREGEFGLSGRVDGLLTLQGPWAARRLGGFMDLQSASLVTPSGAFPISEASLRIDSGGVRLAPFKVKLAPRVELVAEGSISSAASDIPTSASALEQLSYQIAVAAKSVPLHDLLAFGRAMGVRIPEGLDAQGWALGSVRLEARVWPIERPQLSGQVELHGARLLIPGLTEPLNVPKARILLQDGRVVADPVVAVMGMSVFTGRLEHQGPRNQAWQFDVKADSLSLNQGALWFDVLGRRAPLPLLEQLPGLRSLVERRAAAKGLFSALHAQGRFSTPRLTYRGLTLHDFGAGVEISDRVVRIERASFRTGLGRGRGSGEVDLTQAPARITAQVALQDARLQQLVPFLPVALRKVRGTYSLDGRFETRGLSHQEMSANLEGRGTLRLKDVSFGDFDPVQTLARASRSGILEPLAVEAFLHSATLAWKVRDRQVAVAEGPVELEGAQIEVGGTYSFEGALDLRLRGNLRHLTRRWTDLEGEMEARSRPVNLRVAGPLDRLALVPVQQVARQTP